jgi:isopenicillin N synthase-like dioxygenase
MSPEVLKISYTDPNAPKLFEHSLKNSGFAVIKDHPISSLLINDVYRDWSTFFSSDKKQRYLYNEDAQDGYFPYLTENAKGYNTKDLKEFYHIYPWGRMPENMASSSLELYDALAKTASTFLSWIQKSTSENVRKLFTIPLPEMIEDSQSNLFRIIHYPPISGEEEKGAIRAAAHEDINLLTVLVAGSQPGLQVMGMDKKWHDVSCDKGTIVVNSGDMLKMISNNYYPSTTHRVINPSTSANLSRYSMPLFLHPRDEVVLCDEYTAGTYLKERLEEIGLK